MPRWGKCEYRQLKNFTRKMERLQEKEFEEFCQAATKELAARLLAKVIKRTPVGTIPELDGPLTVKVRGESYIAQTTTRSGEKVFRKRKGKSYTLLTKAGQIREKYWSGYSGGTLRRGWTAKTEGQAAAGSGNGQDPYQYAQSLSIQKAGSNYIIEIINPVSYASYVEYGHRQTPGRYVPALGKRLKASWVPGRYMLTISEQEIRRQAPALLEKKLQGFLKEIMK